MRDNYLEIDVVYAEDVVRGLLKSGYQVMLWQDGESDNVVGVEYVHPEYDEMRFRPCECFGNCKDCKNNREDDYEDDCSVGCDNCEKTVDEWERAHPECSKFGD